jgi:hypothetical protein
MSGDWFNGGGAGFEQPRGGSRQWRIAWVVHGETPRDVPETGGRIRHSDAIIRYQTQRLVKAEAAAPYAHIHSRFKLH